MNDRIRQFQKGSPIPKGALKNVTALWNRDVAKNFAQRKGLLEEDTKYRQILRSKMLEALSSDKQVLGAQKGVRELASRLAKRKLKPPSSFKASSEIKGGSLISVLAPPYDTIWAQNLGDASSNQSSEDDLGGTFGLDVTADGSAYAAAAIGAIYRPVSNSRVAHFRPFMRYSYHYVDSAWLASTAHNDGYLHARVVSMDSKFNIVKWPPDDTSVQLWSDGVSVWDDTHDVQVDDEFPGILDVQFELAPDHVYLLWCWCECSLDDGSASFAFSNMQVTVPFMVVREDDM